MLETWVKRGGELSTDHQLMVSWIMWQRRKPDRPGKPKRRVRVCWECLAEDPVKMVLNSNPQRSFNHILEVVRSMES